MSSKQSPVVIPIVRAIDVGYGHVKFVLHHDVPSMKIDCGRFPSRSPRAQGTDMSAGVMTKLDVFTVEVDGRRYEVGNDVISAAGAHDASEILSRDFALSDAYMARLYGALSYMLPKIKHAKIDFLILGLPNLTYNAMANSLAKKVQGEHVINITGAKVEIANVLVFPQPMGAFFDYGFRQRKVDELSKRVNLIVDPGYNTLDWLFSEGLAPNKARSDSVELGMSSVIRAIAEDVIAKAKKVANIERVINRIDYAISHGQSYRLSGQEIDLEKHIPASKTIIDQAINALHKKVGEGDDIDNIFIAGGGADFYFQALQDRFPDHKVFKLDDPQFSNVRGFQLVGMNKASSAMRATGV